LQRNTRSPFVDLFLAVAPNSFGNGKSARVLDGFVWMLERQIDCANPDGARRQSGGATVGCRDATGSAGDAGGVVGVLHPGIRYA
jgi:hypothetical protein